MRVARDFMTEDPAYDGQLLRREELTAADIFAAYDDGDPVAQKVFDNAIELWGMAAANLVSLFNPAMIVFGGGIFGPATKFLDTLLVSHAVLPSTLFLASGHSCLVQAAGGPFYADGSDAVLLRS